MKLTIELWFSNRKKALKQNVNSDDIGRSTFDFARWIAADWQSLPDRIGEFRAKNWGPRGTDEIQAADFSLVFAAFGDS